MGQIIRHWTYWHQKRKINSRYSSPVTANGSNEISTLNFHSIPQSSSPHFPTDNIAPFSYIPLLTTFWSKDCLKWLPMYFLQIPTKSGGCRPVFPLCWVTCPSVNMDTPCETQPDPQQIVCNVYIVCTFCQRPLSGAINRTNMCTHQIALFYQ